MASIAVIGGTGQLGKGIARRLAKAGHDVTIGSRSAEKAQAAATELGGIGAAANEDAAVGKDFVIVTVPYANQKPTLELIRDKVGDAIVVDTTVPLVPPKVMRVQLPPAGSAGQIAQDILGDDVRVVSAFQNVAAHHLQEGHALDCDVLVCGNDKEARAQVITLVEAAGMRGFHAGSIANAAAAEALTSLLIFINKQYSCHAGIRITGLADSD